MSSEAGTRQSPRFAPTSTPAKRSTTCTRPSTAQTGPRKRRGSRSISPIRLWSRPSTPCSTPRSRGCRPRTCPRSGSGRLDGAVPTGAEDPVEGSPRTLSADRCADGVDGDRLAMDRNGDRSSPARTGARAVQPRASRASRGAVRATVAGPKRLCGSCLRSRRQRQNDARALVARGRRGLEHTAWVAVEPRERDAQHFWLALTNALAAALGGSVEPLADPGFRGEAVVERLLEPSFARRAAGARDRRPARAESPEG